MPAPTSAATQLARHHVPEAPLAVERSAQSATTCRRKQWKTTAVWPPRAYATAHAARKTACKQPVRKAARSNTCGPDGRNGAESHRGRVDRPPIYYCDRPSRWVSACRRCGAVQRDTALVRAAELCLAMRSDQTDGIVIAHLEDVAPDGRVTYLSEGEVRLLHRRTATGGCDPAPGTARSFTRADGAAVTPGELMHVEIPLLPVAARIKKGHRIRLSLSGADAGTFPMLTEALRLGRSILAENGSR